LVVNRRSSSLSTTKTKGRRDKGHNREIELTVEAMRSAGSALIPFEQLVEVTRACFAVHQSIATGQPVRLKAGEPASNREN
jgi:hypothetical protein